MAFPPRHHPVPRRASSIGIVLFLTSLGMLFLASMLGYVLMRAQHPDLAQGTIVLPRTLLASTLLMLASSLTIHLAMTAIRRERQALFRMYLNATMVFAALFVLVQTPAMVQLYRQHTVTMSQWEAERATTQPTTAPTPTNRAADERIATKRSVPFYALVMFLILLHALHVVGGMVALGLVAYNAAKERYDHENYAGVRNCVLYWHFLDVVWIAMYTLLAAFG